MYEGSACGGMTDGGAEMAHQEGVTRRGTFLTVGENIIYYLLILLAQKNEQKLTLV
jgi:hypothetical protein